MGDALWNPTDDVGSDLNHLEKTLQQLGVDYELFFAARADGKSNVLPPQRRLAEVEAIVRFYSKTPPRRTSDRFRFNTLVHRYRINIERWNRRTRQQEELGVGRSALPVTTGPQARRERATADVSRPAVLAAVRIPGGDPTGDQVRDLYLAYRKARKARGLPVSDLEYAPFADRLMTQLERVRAKAPGRDVELRVDELGGKVRIAVRPVAPRTSATP